MLTYYLHVYQDGASIFQLYSYYAKNEIYSFQNRSNLLPPPPHFFFQQNPFYVSVYNQRIAIPFNEHRFYHSL